MKSIQENLKLFYLGLENEEPFLYKNQDLTTHALIIGMTGSGKTGLGITLLEEACIDNIPSIIIDPKGDMTNLCLAFQNLNEDEFLEYIDESEAANAGLSKAQMAKNLAESWQNGLESTFQSKDRIKLLKDSVNFTIYTPKSQSGVNISLINDFIAPQDLDNEAFTNYITSLTNSILSLLGLNLDENSKEFILITQIFDNEFKKQKNITIKSLITMIYEPPFSTIGAFDVDQFYPKNERFKLSIKLNSLIASPAFKAYTQGERLNISNMLFDKDAKAKCNIFTISHLNDNERMFFVTLLLNELIAWMRTTQGTNSLRTILYMDEIFGFFPPNSNPSSKTPMLTLLKQARAFGVGCVLSTQNPVDLDYKGLSNIGTWFIGRLQTSQDKARVIDGLTDITDSNKAELQDLLSNLPKRHFLVKNIHDSKLRTISTRWALSYLKGPLTSSQISNLMAHKKSTIQNQKQHTYTQKMRPIIASDIKQFFANVSDELSGYLLGSAKVRFYDAKLQIDNTKDVSFLCELSVDDECAKWDEASVNPSINLIQNIEQSVNFNDLPRFILNLKSTNDLKKNLKEFIYRNENLSLYSALDINSNVNESKDEFMLRLQDKLNEIMEEKTDELTVKFEKEKKRLQDKLTKASYKLEKEQKDLSSSSLNAILNIGASLLGAFLGSKTSTNIGKVASGVKSASRVLKEKSDVKISEQTINDINNELDELILKFQNDISILKEQNDIKNINIKEIKITPKKSDIFDENVCLVWK